MLLWGNTILIVRPHNVIVREHNLIVGPHNVIVREHNLIVRPHTIIVREHNLFVRQHNVIVRQHDIVVWPQLLWGSPMLSRSVFRCLDGCCQTDYALLWIGVVAKGYTFHVSQRAWYYYWQDNCSANVENDELCRRQYSDIGNVIVFIHNEFSFIHNRQPTTPD